MEKSQGNIFSELTARLKENKYRYVIDTECTFSVYVGVKNNLLIRLDEIDGNGKNFAIAYAMDKLFDYQSINDSNGNNKQFTVEETIEYIQKHFLSFKQK